MNENTEKLLRWLQMLFYIHLVGALLSTLALASTAFSFAVGSWYTWAQRGVNLGVTLALLLLPNSYYRYAGMVKTAAVILELLPLGLHALLRMDVQTYTFWLGLLGQASIALSLLALSLEYIGHAAGSTGDKTKWFILLICSFTISLLSNVAASLLQPLLNNMAQAGELWLIKLWNISARTLILGVSVIYLVLLRRLVRHQEEVLPMAKLERIELSL